MLATGVATSAVFLYGCDDGAIKAPTITAQQPTTVTAFANGTESQDTVLTYTVTNNNTPAIGSSGTIDIADILILW